MRKALYYGLIALGLSFNLGAQFMRDTERDAVAMRMIAHQIMLWQGDSIQAIPPVIALDEWSYRINFNADIQFDPGVLVDFIGQVMVDYSIAEQYRVQVKSCQGDSIIYSFQVGGSKTIDIVPCLGRIQEKACYYLQIKVLHGDSVAAAVPVNEPEALSEESVLIPNWLYFLVILIVLLATLGYIMYRRAKRTIPEPLHDSAEVRQIGSTFFSQQNLTLSFNNTKTELSAKEADLLAFLALHLNQRVEKERILNAVWGNEGDYVGRTLDVYISKLRKKLASDPSIRIVNIRGVGYQLLVE